MKSFKLSLFLILNLLFYVSVFAADSRTKKEKIRDFVNEQREDFLEEINKLKDKLELRAGLSLVNRKIQASYSTEDDVQALGFQTAIAIRASPRYEINVSSYVHFGKAKELDFEFEGLRLHGDGSHRTAAFAPLLKIIPGFTIATNLSPYVFGGPSWSLQALKLKPFVDQRGVSRVEHKLTYESFGGVVGFGLEEQLPKDTHPYFIEFLFSYMKAYKVKLVDASDFIEVKTISYEDRQSNINGAIYMMNFGITIF